MKVTIITVTFNSAATVEDTLKSVQSQDYGNIEHIIVDGGSSDGTLEILGQYTSGIARIIKGPDKGIYDALNKGIAAATGDVIGVLHSDDVYTDESVISDYVSVFKKENCDAVYSDLYYVARNDTRRIIRRWKSGNYKPGAFLNGWMPPHPTFFAKRTVYEKFGGFNLSFKTAADYELMLRLIHLNKISLVYLPKFTVKMRTGGASNVTLASRLNANMEDRRAWRLNGLRPRFYTLLLKPLRKLRQFLG